MSNFPKVTDADLEEQRKKGSHRRTEKMNDTVNNIAIAIIWVSALVGIVFLASCAWLVWKHLENPAAVTLESFNFIIDLFKFLGAATGGYLIHLLGRNGINKAD